MRKQDPDDPVVYGRRTFWDWFKGWPLRVVLSAAAFYLFIVIFTIVDQHFPLWKLWD
jgi:hypothetical protein